MNNTTYDITDPYGCMPVLATISMNRSEKEIETKFLIRYATILKWQEFPLNNPKHGFKRFLVEIMRRINFDEIKKLHARIGNVQFANEAAIASIVQMPMIDIDDYMSSAIRWKPQYIEMLRSIDQKLLEHQYRLISKLIEFGESGRKSEGEDRIFEGPEIKEVIKLTDAQIKDIKSSPLASQLAKAEKLAEKKGKSIPPKTQLYAHRLAKWASKVAAMPNV